MALPAATPSPPPDEDAALHAQLEAYPWHSDAEYQSGLAAILGPQEAEMSPTQVTDLTLRARCFFFVRKAGQHVEFDAYSQWRAAQPAHMLTPLEGNAALQDEPSVLRSPDTSTESTPTKKKAEQAAEEAAANEEPAAATFSEIMELIRSGKRIPGVKDIPKTVLLGQESESSQPQRQKPWETVASERTSLRDAFFPPKQGA